MIIAGAALCSDAGWASDGSFPLRWSRQGYVWYYNPTGQPAWLTEDEALSLVQDIAQRWAACGVPLHYAGLTDRLAGVVDGMNVVGWRRDGKNFSAWTSWAAHRDGRAIEADVILYANVYELYRQQGMDARLELRKSIAHEFGHVLGLSHSDRPEDAMSVKVRTRPEWVLPSAEDMRRCRAVQDTASHG